MRSVLEGKYHHIYNGCKRGLALHVTPLLRVPMAEPVSIAVQCLFAMLEDVSIVIATSVNVVTNETRSEVGMSHWHTMLGGRDGFVLYHSITK